MVIQNIVYQCTSLISKSLPIRPASCCRALSFKHLYRNHIFLSDSRAKGKQKTWEKLLYMMDSTTITLFDNILKGVGRHPKRGKKKDGMKVHTVMKYHLGVPMVVQLTSAAKHDHYLLKEVHLPKDETLTMDRAYVDYYTVPYKPFPYIRVRD